MISNYMNLYLDIVAESIHHVFLDTKLKELLMVLLQEGNKLRRSFQPFERQVD